MCKIRNKRDNLIDLQCQECGHWILEEFTVIGLNNWEADWHEIPHSCIQELRQQIKQLESDIEYYLRELSQRIRFLEN